MLTGGGPVNWGLRVNAGVAHVNRVRGLVNRQTLATLTGKFRALKPYRLWVWTRIPTCREKFVLHKARMQRAQGQPESEKIASE